MGYSRLVQEPYPISNQNGCKTIPIEAPHTCITRIGDYPHPLNRCLPRNLIILTLGSKGVETKSNAELPKTSGLETT